MPSLKAKALPAPSARPSLSINSIITASNVRNKLSIWPDHGQCPPAQPRTLQVRSHCMRPFTPALWCCTKNLALTTAGLKLKSEVQSCGIPVQVREAHSAFPVGRHLSNCVLSDFAVRKAPLSKQLLLPQPEADENARQVYWHSRLRARKRNPFRQARTAVVRCDNVSDLQLLTMFANTQTFL